MCVHMKIKLLKNGYKTNKQFYYDFLEDKIKENNDYFGEDYIYLDQAPDFPIYIKTQKKKERESEFLEAFYTLSKSYMRELPKETWFRESFWHSLFCTKKVNFIIENYPQIMDSHNSFKNIVVKAFNRENYVYKYVLGVQAVETKTQDIEDEKEKIKEQDRYYRLIANNGFTYTTMLTYPILRNKNFIINMLDIIDEENLAMTERIYHNGREKEIATAMLYEFRQNYPIKLYPLMDKDTLKTCVVDFIEEYS